MEARPKILMVAYACDPEAHGEHWMGWNWAEQAAKLGELHLLTPTWARAAVERHAAAAGITAYFPEIAEPLLRATAPMGNNGLWIRQYFWQHRAAALAARLHAAHGFAIVHQTTFHTFRVPFRSAFLGIPAVWGPIAGGESSPPGFSRYLGSARWAERVRPVLNALCLAAPAVQRSLRIARALLVANHTTLDFLPSWCRGKSRIVPSNWIDDTQMAAGPLARKPRGTELSLLYLGNFVPRRSIPLVLDAMVAARDVPVRLTIAGDGPSEGAWRRDVARLGLERQVHFAGRIPRAQLADLYASTDALVFPGLRDSGGSALLEAMSLGVPVVCLDWGGPAEMLSAESGVKVPVTSPEASVAAMAEAFRRLWHEPEWARALGERAAVEVRERFSWARKRAVLDEVYAEVMAK
jgi:glycosyltransferase involved in cell wall biosynthesis